MDMEGICSKPELRVSVARTFRERLGGLLARPPLGPEEALLLMPCRSIHTFGMGYGLDILFLDKDGDILAAHRGLTPWRMLHGPRGAVMTLEMAAGTLDRLGHLGAGDWRRIILAAGVSIPCPA